MPLFTQTPDGSIEGPGGKVIFFSLKRFISDICQGNCCFICGARPSDTIFNDEHVIPNWLLKKYNLHSKMIVLPNGTSYRYDQYKVPCCKDCNEFMGDVVETPVSKLFAGGRDVLYKHLEEEGPILLFNWLCLMFIKTHLKDKLLRMHRDRRAGDEKLSSYITWEELHHIHCMARLFYTGVKVEPGAFGSMFFIPALLDKHHEHFDFSDMYNFHTMIIRIDEVAVISVLNDSCAVNSMVQPVLKKIAGPLSVLQLRELYAKIAFGNAIIKERPEFYTYIDLDNNDLVIKAKHPKIIELVEYESEDYGEVMYYACKDVLEAINGQVSSDVIKNIKAGLYTYLFDDNGDFNNRSIIWQENSSGS